MARTFPGCQCEQAHVGHMFALLWQNSTPVQQVGKKTCAWYCVIRVEQHIIQVDSIWVVFKPVTTTWSCLTYTAWRHAGKWVWKHPRAQAWLQQLVSHCSSTTGRAKLLKVAEAAEMRSSSKKNENQEQWKGGVPPPRTVIHTCDTTTSHLKFEVNAAISRMWGMCAAAVAWQTLSSWRLSTRFAGGFEGGESAWEGGIC